MEEKNYKNWQPLKSRLQNEPDINRAFFHEREIWYCHLGENIGFEQDGKGIDFLRPIIIIRKFNNEIFWGIPLTSNNKESIYYFKITTQDNVYGSAILSQIRLIDAKRLSYKVGDLPEEEFGELTKKLKALIP
ncbi:MAG: type II toxin-antitoxin system PemK/MazF family toxin [Candidatus Paceibacterota bacterium]|jgi:mRNA interferase MazF